MLRYYTCQEGRFHYQITVLNEDGDVVYHSRTVWHEGVSADDLEALLVDRANKHGFNIKMK